MSRGLFLSAVVSMVFQATIALLLLVFAYVQPFGIKQFAANGENLLRKADSLQNGLGQCTTAVAGSPQLVRSLLVSYHQIFEKLASFLGIAAVILLVCLVVQTIVLVSLKRSAGRK